VPQGGQPVPYGTLRVQAAPGLATPGGTTAVTAAFTNNGLLTLGQVQFVITVPVGWTMTAATPVTAGPVGSGGVVQASWQVTVPPDANPGQAPIGVRAVYTAGDQRGVSYGSVAVLGAYASLAGLPPHGCADRGRAGRVERADGSRRNLSDAVRRRGFRQRTLHQLVAVHQVVGACLRAGVYRYCSAGSTCRGSAVTGQ